MKFFIDSADIDEIKQALELGLVDGVTTNPTLVAKSGRDFAEVVSEIASVVSGPVNAEVTCDNTDQMIEQGKELSKIAPNVVVKVPMTLDGLKAVRGLSLEGIDTNVTLVFSAVQAVLCAKAGASYVSPFVGRLDDVSEVGMNLVSDIRTIFDNYAVDTKILVASVRSPVHVLESLMIGADVITIPFKVIKQLSKHPLTDIGIGKFNKDWEQRKK